MQQGSGPKIQRTYMQDEEYNIYDYSLDSQLESLSKQIVNSMTESSKQKVAVIEFSDLGGNISELGKYLSEELITRLFITGKFEVIERRLLNKVLDEQKLSVSDLIDPNSIKELGKILGVDAVVSGTVTDLGTSLKINARIISTETGLVFSVAAAEIHKDKSIEKLMSKSFIAKGTDQPTEKKFSDIQKTPIEKVVNEKSLIFYMEDFSEVEVGMIPRDWIGGEKLMVKSGIRKKYLTNFERVNQTVTVQNIKFPNNFRFEWTIELWGTHQKISLGNVKIEIFPDEYASGEFAADFILDRNRKTVEGNFYNRAIKIGFEKKGPLCRLLLNDIEIYLIRYTNFVSPTSFSFEFNNKPFKLYNIVGTNLCD